MESNPSTGLQFPNVNIPDSQKDKAWHKQAVETITNRSLNQTYTINYVMMNECVNFFQSLNSGDEYKFLQEASDGEVLPAKWKNLNRIRPKLSVVLGEFLERGYDINVKAINTEAVSRKLAAKEQMRVKIRLQPAANMIEQGTGVPVAEQGLPEDEEELEDHFSTQYKETSEFVMESALKWLAKKFKWDYTRMQLFADMLIMGRCFAKVEIVNGLPRIRRVDPRLMIFDTNASDDFLSDSTYYGEVRYMGVAEAIETYNLTKEEIEEIRTGQKDSSFTQISSSPQDFMVKKDNQILYYKQEAGELRVLVVTAYFEDTKAYNKEISVDQFGNNHVRDAHEKAKGKNVKQNRIKIWRTGTLIAGKVLKNYGEVENQPRNTDDLGATWAPYVSCLPFFMNGTSLSVVQMLKPLQELKNIVMYNIELAMSRAGAKGFIYDIAQLPEGMDIEAAMKYLRVFGIGFVDSKKDGIQNSFNQFSSFDMTISDSVIQYINIMGLIDAEMDSISGINEARQGQSAGASQAVGVTQSLLLQSNLSTAPLTKLFKMFSSDCFNLQAKLVKITWAGKEKYAPIIGETGVDFLKEDIELDMNDYGVFVEEVPPMLDDLSSFREFVTAAVQAGSLDFIDALELMQEKDIRIATRKYRKAITKKEEQQMAYEQQMQQAQAEAEAQAQQQAMEAQAAMEQQKMAAQGEMEQIKGANNLRGIFAKGKLDLAGKKIDALK
jgi:hypothetical protein